MTLKLVIISILIAVCWCRPPFPDATDDNFQNECLEAHNNYRAKHRSVPLTIDQSIVAFAKNRCNTVSQQEGLDAGHDGSGDYGENLYWGGSSGQIMNDGIDAVESWYDEVQYYDYNNPGFSEDAGHFTQLVWNSSTSVGCARCAGQGSECYETYIVCNYLPPGNYDGEFPKNVFPSN